MKITDHDIEQRALSLMLYRLHELTDAQLDECARRCPRIAISRRAIRERLTAHRLAYCIELCPDAALRHADLAPDDFAQCALRSPYAAGLMLSGISAHEGWRLRRACDQAGVVLPDAAACRILAAI